MKTLISCLRTVLALGLICFASLTQADTPMFYTEHGKAVAGYDVVTYFNAETPQPGDPAHAVVWKGAVWQFVSRKNREQFEANPKAYAPQYGGYCAFGVSQGIILDTDPSLYQLRGGKLYLIHDEAVFRRWGEDIDGHISAANAQWPGVLREE